MRSTKDASPAIGGESHRCRRRPSPWPTRDGVGGAFLDMQGGSGGDPAALVPGKAAASPASIPAVRISWDREGDAAYISLIEDDERVAGVSRNQVALEDIAEASGVDALHSLVLDFDRDGKLIGIEVLSPRDALRESTLRQAT